MHPQELDFVTLPHPKELFTLALSWHTHMQLSAVHGVNLAFAWGHTRNVIYSCLKCWYLEQVTELSSCAAAHIKNEIRSCHHRQHLLHPRRATQTPFLWTISAETQEPTVLDMNERRMSEKSRDELFIYWPSGLRENSYITGVPVT